MQLFAIRDCGIKPRDGRSKAWLVGQWRGEQVHTERGNQRRARSEVDAVVGGNASLSKDAWDGIDDRGNAGALVKREGRSRGNRCS